MAIIVFTLQNKFHLDVWEMIPEMKRKMKKNKLGLSWAKLSTSCGWTSLKSSVDLDSLNLVW